MDMQFWKRWCATRARIRSDASDLMHEHGSQALAVVARMAKAERGGRLISPALPPGHWGRVQREMRKSLARRRRAGRS